MNEICDIEQKFIDESNNHLEEYKEGVNEDDIVSWNDEILACSDKEIQWKIKHNNEELKHLRYCKTKGCKDYRQMLKDFHLLKFYKKREDMLTGRKPLI